MDTLYLVWEKYKNPFNELNKNDDFIRFEQENPCKLINCDTSDTFSMGLLNELRQDEKYQKYDFFRTFVNIEFNLNDLAEDW